MIRALVVLAWWGFWVLIHGIWGIPWMAITRRILPLYNAAMWAGRTGAWLAGADIEVRGREHLAPGQTYIFMSNHTSNLDPPIVIPAIPGRTSVLVKKELFRVPLLGTAMRLAGLVPVDRHDREAAIASMRQAVEVLRSGLHMTVFPEGTRSADGRLQRFKKGPFHLAEESGIPVVPISTAGTQILWPKHRFAMKPGKVVLTFHPPLWPQQVGDRDAMMVAVRAAIESGLPPDQRSETPAVATAERP